jgi:peptide/nickel transport system substrate-binding protein
MATLRMCFIALIVSLGAFQGPAVALAETLVVAVSADVLDWHPGRSRSAADSALLDNVLERLVALDRSGGPVPALAVAWRLVSPDTWEFQLRPDVRFDDGTPFDADVARRNLLLQRDDFRAASRTWLRSIVDVEAVDALTLRLRTDGHVPDLPVALAWAGRMAPLTSDAPDAGYPEALLAQPLGTGPYRLVAWERGRSLVFERRDGWWGEAPDAGRVEVRVVPDDTARADALLSGTVDAAFDVASADVARLRAAGLSVEHVPGQRLTYLFLDSYRGRGGPPPEGSPGIVDGSPNPLRDARVRGSLSLAIDRSALAASVHGGTVTPVARPVLPGWTSAGVAPENGTDSDEAQRRLAQAGFPDGFDLTIVVLEGQTPRARETIEAVASDWAAIGVRVTIDAPAPIDAARRYSQLEASAGLMSWGGLSARVTAWRGMFGSDPTAGTFGGQNVGRFVDPEVNALLARLATPLDPRARAQAEAALLTAFDDATPVVPLFVVDTLVALTERWTVAASGVELVPFADLERRR